LVHKSSPEIYPPDSNTSSKKTKQKNLRTKNQKKQKKLADKKPKKKTKENSCYWYDMFIFFFWLGFSSCRRNNL
jgi:hypothetical protein